MVAAEERCRLRGVRLTDQRRAVLDALLQVGRPCGAYELIESLYLPGGKRPAPVAIYRALDFLRGIGLVHRLESRNAFIACAHGHETSDSVVFMICERCQSVVETISPGMEAHLDMLARSNGFHPRSTVVEMAGLCGGCGKP